jgi:dihydrofolate reductase
MTKPEISIVVGIIEKTRAIGRGSDLLVRIPDDLKRFKSLTTGHPVIMGRKTYESIGKPLPNRTNIVVTRNADFKAEGVIVCTNIEDAIAEGTKKDSKEIFIIGGGEIYKQALPFTDKIYLTLFKTEIGGDVFFPDYSEFTKETFREERFDEKTGIHYTWVNLEK